MHIKSIVAATTIALIAGVGSVSADELSVDGTTGVTDTPFALLDGIATEQMSIQEMGATHGAALLLPALQAARESARSSDGQTTNGGSNVYYEFTLTNLGSY